MTNGTVHAKTGRGWSRGVDRASIAVSLGLAAGSTLMRKPILAVAAVLAMLSAALAFAQDAPLRGVGLLALNASEAQSGLGSGSSSVPSARNIETPDEGGGTVVRNGRGGGDAGPAKRSARSPDEPVAPALPDPLPPAAVPGGGDSSIAPAAAVPKRPSYRWQSLVPGAIK